MKRREFIKRSAMSVGGVMAGVSVASAATDTFDPYERFTLAKTQVKVSRFCLGTGMRGGNRQSDHTRLGKEKFTALVKGAYDRGVRTFDMADLYGTHPYFADAMKGVPRDSYSILTKVWWMHGMLPEEERPDADVVVARFLKELQTDYLDMVLLHCVTAPDWPTKLRKQMDDLAKLKEKGTIRALGVSCHSLEALQAAATEPWVDSVHTRINPYGMSMDGSPDQVVPVLKKISAAGKGVVGMKLIGEGRLSHDDEKRDASVKFVLGLGCVNVLNVGCESLAEVDDFAARVRKVSKS